MSKYRTGKYGRGRWARNAELARYLNISAMSLWRWKRNPTLNFPAASIINGIEHNDLDIVDAWMDSRRTTNKEVAA